jgi:hypothetical protein
MSAEALRLRAVAAVLTLLSGAVMMLAGYFYIGHTESWTTAGFITIPGGVLILAAFALAGRADLVDGRTPAPSASRAGRAGAMGGTLLSGGVMVFAGYAAAAWGWGLAALLAAVGGLLVSIAFAVDRRRTQGTSR